MTLTPNPNFNPDPDPNPTYTQVYGTHSLQPAVLPHGHGAIVYVPRANVCQTGLGPQ